MGRYGAGSPTLGRMGRFVPGPGLDERIAAGVMRRRADALIRDTEALIRVYAPPAKVWVTAHDERVRPTHNEADGQSVPSNLRFELSKPGRSGEITASKELAVRPNDPNLSLANRIRGNDPFGCRCVAPEIPGLVAAGTRSEVTVRGSRVRGVVEVPFPRVVESNFPSSPDTGGGWANKALADARRRA
jgi:hypothetical protein